jgi:hypothetical protein
MRRVFILILALVVALAALPISFAWSQGGGGHKGWARWSQFWRPYTTGICSSTNECNVIFDSITGIDESEDYFTEPKEVGDTTANIACGGKSLVVTITEAYPGYEATIDFCIKNVGLYPATVTGINTQESTPFYAQLDFTGVESGITLQPGEVRCCQLVVYGVPQTEEAQGKTFTFDITIDFECVPGFSDCGTAYAYYPGHAICFIALGYSKWGWINGPVGPGTYTFDIWAGAAHCNTSNGTYIGTLTVDYDGSTATVTYDITNPDYRMTSTHLYVYPDIGTPIPPNNKPTIPGQYPDSHVLDYATTDTFTVTGLSGNIYVIAHATVACR